MYAVLAASVLTLAKPARVAGLVVIGAGVLVPFLLDPDLTSTGHVLSVVVGIAIMTAGQRKGSAEEAGQDGLRAAVPADAEVTPAGVERQPGTGDQRHCLPEQLRWVEPVPATGHQQGRCLDR